MKNFWKLAMGLVFLLLGTSFFSSFSVGQSTPCWPTKYDPIPKCAVEGVLIGKAPLKVTFNASGSFDPDGGPIQEYEWTFLWNGQKISGYYPTIEQEFWGSGTYLVQVRVRNDEGKWSKDDQGRCQPVVVTILPLVCKPGEIYGLKAKYQVFKDEDGKRVPGVRTIWKIKKPMDGYFILYLKRYDPLKYWVKIPDWADYTEFKPISGPILANKKDKYYDKKTDSYIFDKLHEPLNRNDEVLLVYICGDSCKMENHHPIGVAKVRVPIVM